MFVPLEAPAEIRMALVLIEVISHIMKCFSLSIRLFANIFSGHVLLYIIGSSVFLVLLQPEMFVVGFSLILPFFSVIIFMELFVAFLQAYVFSTLSSMYFKEILASK
jgi:F0F1-type ATP synthase membrane subunit a